MEWDESKRQTNLKKHGLDFAVAHYVLKSPFRLDVDTIRNNENRTHSFAYVFDYLAVLSVGNYSWGKHLNFANLRTCNCLQGAADFCRQACAAYKSYVSRRDRGKMWCPVSSYVSCSH